MDRGRSSLFPGNRRIVDRCARLRELLALPRAGGSTGRGASGAGRKESRREESSFEERPGANFEAGEAQGNCVIFVAASRKSAAIFSSKQSAALYRDVATAQRRFTPSSAPIATNSTLELRREFFAVAREQI